MSETNSETNLDAIADVVNDLLDQEVPENEQEVTEASIMDITTPCATQPELWQDRLPKLRAHLLRTPEKKETDTQKRKRMSFADGLLSGGFFHSLLSKGILSQSEMAWHMGIESPFLDTYQAGRRKTWSFTLGKKGDVSTSLHFPEVCEQIKLHTRNFLNHQAAAKAADPGVLPEDDDKRSIFLREYAEKHGIDITNGLDAASLDYAKQLARAKAEAKKAIDVKNAFTKKKLEAIFTFHKSRTKAGGALTCLNDLHTLVSDKDEILRDVILPWIPDVLDFVRIKHAAQKDGKVVKNAAYNEDGAVLAKALTLGGGSKTDSYPKETALSKWKDAIGSKNEYDARLKELAKTTKKGSSIKVVIATPLADQLAALGIQLGNFNTSDMNTDHIRVAVQDMIVKLEHAFKDGKSHGWIDHGSVEQAATYADLSTRDKFTEAYYMAMATVQRMYGWHHSLPSGYVADGLLDKLGIKEGPVTTGGQEPEGTTKFMRLIGDMMLGTEANNVNTAHIHVIIDIDESGQLINLVIDGQQKVTSIVLVGGGFVPIGTTGTDLDQMNFSDGTAIFGSGNVFMTRQKVFDPGEIKDAPWEQDGAVFLDEEYPELAANFYNCMFSVALYDFTRVAPENRTTLSAVLFEKLNSSSYQLQMKSADMFSPVYWVSRERAEAVASLMSNPEIIKCFHNSNDAKRKSAVTSHVADGMVPAALQAFVGYIIADAFALLSDGKYPGVTYNSKTMHGEVVRLLSSKFLTDDIFYDVLTIIADVLKAAGYATNLHRAFNEDGILAKKTTNANKTVPVYHDSRLIDWIRGMILLRMPKFEMEFDETGKVVEAVGYAGGNLPSIYERLADSAALNKFIDLRAFYRDEIEMYGEGNDPWLAAVARGDIKAAPKTLVFATKKSGGVVVPYTVDISNAGRNTMGYVKILGNVHSVVWDAYLNHDGRMTYEIFEEARPESDMPGEDGE